MRKPYYIQTAGSKITCGGIQTVSQEQITTIDSQDVAYWLIDMRIWKEGWEILCYIRRHLSPTVYLKPVLFLIDSDTIPQDIVTASDGNIHRSSCDERLLEEWVSRVEQINQWISHLPNAHTNTDTNIAFKVLRLITSRNIELEPITTIRRHSGYVYPLLEPLFAKRDTGVLETLAFLESQHLLNGRFISRAHFCGHCSSAFLNFKETCPQCTSDDIRSAELIHHFKCAYTAEISNFRKGDLLSCPKCERDLKHIGVDYDKPSIIHNCNQCSHTFQDPKIMTTCYNCGREAEPEHQQTRTIYAYSASAIGLNAADYGLDTLFTNILDSELNLFSETAFNDFFRIEKSRIQRYKKSNSSLAIIRFSDLDKLYIKLGSRAREVFFELSIIFKSVLRTSDVISAKNETIFFVLMTETATEHAQRAADRLQEGVTNLFKNNLDFSPEMSTKIYSVNSDLEIDSALEGFLADVD